MPRQHLLQQQPPDILNVARRCVVYKLLLLENSRDALDRELRHVTERAHVEVHNFLSTGQATNTQECDNIIKALEVKYHVVQQLSATVKNLTTDPQSIVRVPSGPRWLDSHPQLSRDRGIMTSDVLKFGPMLQNILMARSISRAVQVLGATLSLQQLNLHLYSQPESQMEPVLCSVASSSSRHTVLEPPSTPSLNRDKEAKKVTCQEKTHQSIMVKPAPTSQVAILRPPPTWKPIVTGLPHPEKPRQLLVPWLDHHVQVGHQKLTSSQLVHFLRTNATNKLMEVTYGQRSYIQCAPSLSPAAVAAAAPLVDGRTNQQAREGETEERRGVAALVLGTQLFSEMKTQAPVFTVKRVDSGGSITYTCMIASRTELWDVGDIFTEARKVSGESVSSSEKETGLQNCRVGCCCTTLAPHLSASQPSEATEHNLERDPQISSSLAVNHLSVPELHQLSIPEFRIQKFEEMVVVVSHMVSPGNFYIQHADSRQQLQDLHTGLEAGPSFAELQSIPDPGAYVMGWFPSQECWCRAQVTKICGMSGNNNIQVEVRRLDYGDTSSLSLWDLKELRPEMTSLPLQAMQVSLVNVVPVDCQAWTQQAVDWFRDTVENRTLFARLYPRPDGDRVQVELFMERGNIGAMRRGASLSLRLAQNGHAKHNKLRHVGIIKRSSAQEQARAWEKYVISCYTQNKKRSL